MSVYVLCVCVDCPALNVYHILSVSSPLGAGDTMMTKTQSQDSRILCFHGERQMQKKQYQNRQSYARDVMAKDMLTTLQGT